MGFIEEQRRQRQREIEAERQLESARQADSERKQSLIASRRKEIARRRTLYEESLQKFEQSGLPILISELKKLGRYEYFHELERIEDNTFLFNYNNQNLLSMYNTGETHICRMWISTDKVGDKIESKWIEIETDAEGTIRFKASFLGSSTVRQSHLQRNQDVIERALGRAYHHPKVERGKSTHSHPTIEAGPGI